MELSKATTGLLGLTAVALAVCVHSQTTSYSEEITTKAKTQAVRRLPIPDSDFSQVVPFHDTVGTNRFPSQPRKTTTPLPPVQPITPPVTQQPYTDYPVTQPNFPTTNNPDDDPTTDDGSTEPPNDPA